MNSTSNSTNNTKLQENGNALETRKKFNIQGKLHAGFVKQLLKIHEKCNNPAVLEKYWSKGIYAVISGPQKGIINEESLKKLAEGSVYQKFYSELECLRWLDKELLGLDQMRCYTDDGKYEVVQPQVVEDEVLNAILDREPTKQTEKVSEDLADEHKKTDEHESTKSVPVESALNEVVKDSLNKPSALFKEKPRNGHMKKKMLSMKPVPNIAHLRENLNSHREDLAEVDQQHTAANNDLPITEIPTTAPNPENIILNKDDNMLDLIDPDLIAAKEKDDKSSKNGDDEYMKCSVFVFPQNKRTIVELHESFLHEKGLWMDDEGYVYKRVKK